MLFKAHLTQVKMMCKISEIENYIVSMVLNTTQDYKN